MGALWEGGGTNLNIYGISCLLLYALHNSFANKHGVLTIWQKIPESSVESQMEVIFRSEIVDYLQRQSSFSVRNGRAEISLSFAKSFSFQSLSSRKQSREIELQMVSATSFGWFADCGKTLTIIPRASQPIYSNKW